MHFPLSARLEIILFQAEDTEIRPFPINPIYPGPGRVSIRPLLYLKLHNQFSFLFLNIRLDCESRVESTSLPFESRNPPDYNNFFVRCNLLLVSRRRYLEINSVQFCSIGISSTIINPDCDVTRRRMKFLRVNYGSFDC